MQTFVGATDLTTSEMGMKSYRDATTLGRYITMLTMIGSFLLGWTPTVAIAVSIELIPPELTILPGGIVTSDVAVLGLTAEQAVGSFDIDVRFDPTKLTVVGVSFSTLLGDPALFDVLTDVRVGTGHVEFAAVSLLSPEALAALQPASFSLATLSFGGLTSGMTALTFGDAIVDDAFGRPLVGKVPEPSTAALVGFGVLAVGGIAVLTQRRTPGK